MQNAAQYIRMSTDRQELSPALQREAIRRYAEANSFTVVATYADEGRSGVRIANRESLQRLLKDVLEAPQFTAVLVYDVSRWGRFQDVDAAAYYEYHCRMNGVHVIYVAESFSREMTPANVMVKNMKRMMAAEYSRDLAAKARAGQERVLAMGYQMGHLPPLGYRRVSVSSDGRRRQPLLQGQRKMALNDRIEWVLAPKPEVDLVRRICECYARSNLGLSALASLVRAEGWRTTRGAAVTVPSLRDLFDNEALIGNFVWGVTPRKDRILSPAGLCRHRARCVEGAVMKEFLGEQEQSASERMFGARPPVSLSRANFQTRHIDEAEFVQSRVRARDRTAHIAEFGHALARALPEGGLTAAFEGNRCVLYLWDASIHVRLLWRGINGLWKAPRMRLTQIETATLFVRMTGFRAPLDYLLMPTGSSEGIPDGFNTPKLLKKYYLTDEAALVERLRRICG